MNLIDAIIRAIKREFGKDTIIYEDIVEQELNVTSFFIRILSDSLKEELSGLYRYRALVEVTYFDNQLSQSELEEMRLRTSVALSDLPGLTRAEKTDTKVVDGFLITSTTYTLFLSKREKDSLMARLEKGNGKRKDG
ncbi:MAG: hypothetical protein Q4A29_03785 [Eubacteriales bacterium]|nr:hypothetical protein [Eubacteriales bacterium]